MNLDEVKDLLRKLQVKQQKVYRPHMFVEDELKWIAPYRTAEEEKELNVILAVIGGYDSVSIEHEILSNRFTEIERDALLRAIDSPESTWPKQAREAAEKWREWKEYELSHPEPAEDLTLPPAANTVYIRYYEGFIPKELGILRGATVTWLNKDRPYVHGHFVRHIVSEGQRRLFDSTNESTWPEITRDRPFRFTFNQTGVYEYSCVHKSYACGKQPARIAVLATPAELEAWEKERVIGAHELAKATGSN
jgi:plastocyanin